MCSNRACGRTATAARLAARAARLPLVYAPLEALVSKWLGQGEKQLANIFANAATCECQIRGVTLWEDPDYQTLDEAGEGTRKKAARFLRQEQHGYVKKAKAAHSLGSRHTSDHQMVARCFDHAMRAITQNNKGHLEPLKAMSVILRSSPV